MRAVASAAHGKGKITVPHLCFCTDILRNALRPYAGSVQRCFEQGLTVSQCAACLAATEPNLRNSITPQELASPTGSRAIREIFWMTQEEKPEALFQILLGQNHSTVATWGPTVRFIAEQHPHLLSWIPAAYRGQIEEALGAPIEL